MVIKFEVSEDDEFFFGIRTWYQTEVCEGNDLQRLVNEVGAYHVLDYLYG